MRRCAFVGAPSWCPQWRRGIRMASRILGRVAGCRPYMVAIVIAILGAQPARADTDRPDEDELFGESIDTTSTTTTFTTENTEDTENAEKRTTVGAQHAAPIAAPIAAPTASIDEHGRLTEDAMFGAGPPKPMSAAETTREIAPEDPLRLAGRFIRGPIP